MCAIVDASVKGELQAVGNDASEEFRKWLISGRGRIVIGGSKLRRELYAQPAGRGSGLILELRRAGAIIETSDQKIDARAEDLRVGGVCRSNDHHIIALAQISGARLLYSNDFKLQQDFRDKSLIDEPRGSVYSTRRDTTFESSHRKLLENPNLCRRASRRDRQ